MIFSVFQKNWVFGYSWSTFLWHRCYYPHRSRDALSPICGIFGFRVKTKMKAYTKLTVVMCCQIVARKSVAPSSSNFRRRLAQRYTCHIPLNVDGSTLWLSYMLKQLLGSSLMEILDPGCRRNVESGETSLSWLYPRSIGSQCKIKDQRYCVWS